MNRRKFVLSAVAVGLIPAAASAESDQIEYNFQSMFTPFAGAKKQPISRYRGKEIVTYRTAERPGTIIIDTSKRRLFYVLPGGKAISYGIGVGREGFGWSGVAKVGDKQEWPRWIPTKEMQQREPKKYGQYRDGMDGGPENPLGARAIYLYLGKQDTHLRIHGTNQPQSIGTSASNGCFRMINDHVIDLYRRVKVGTPVVVL